MKPDFSHAFGRHHEESAFVPAIPARVFAYADDQKQLSVHMSQSSWKMGGGRMLVETDQGAGRRIGSRIRLSGTVLGLPLSVEEVVTERKPPYRKVWETVGNPNLLVIGHYRMGFQITPDGRHSRIHVFIDYDLPESVPARWLGYLFAGYYAKWCSQQMAKEVAKHFAAGMRMA